MTPSVAATAAVAAEASPSYLDTLFSPLEALSVWLTYAVFGMSEGTAAGAAVQFFLYDVPKVFILLTTMIFVVSVIRSFFPPEKTRKRLEGMPPFTGNILAAGLGILTPF